MLLRLYNLPRWLCTTLQPPQSRLLLRILYSSRMSSLFGESSKVSFLGVPWFTADHRFASERWVIHSSEFVASKIPFRSVTAKDVPIQDLSSSWKYLHFFEKRKNRLSCWCPKIFFGAEKFDVCHELFRFQVWCESTLLEDGAGGPLRAISALQREILLFVFLRFLKRRKMRFARKWGTRPRSFFLIL